MGPWEMDFAAWNAPAPYLISLTLRAARLDTDGNGTSMLLQNHPRLRHLTLQNCGFRWDSSFISSTLTTLHIIHPNVRIAAEDFQLLIASNDVTLALRNHGYRIHEVVARNTVRLA